LSYIDYGGQGQVVIALHGHFGCASMYSQLAHDLGNRCRVIALDQQGHGFSEFGKNYTRDEYIEDINELYRELGIDRATLIGHSLGGVNGYQFAVRYPDKVERLVIEDIGAVVDDDLSFILEWPKTFENARAAVTFLKNNGVENFLYFMESIVQEEDGWKFMFDSKGLVESQRKLNGNWIDDWKRICCDTLLLNGGRSDVLSKEQADEISKVNSNVSLVRFKEAGHTIRDDDYCRYKTAITEFIGLS